MFCSSCGRENLESCKCLVQNPLHKKEALSILLSFQAILIGVVSFLALRMNMEFKEIMPYVSFTIFLFLIILSIFTLFTSKSYLAAFFGCHQATHRSFKFKGRPLNICSRCLGIFVGLLVTSALVFTDYSLIIIFVLSIPLVIDGFYQKMTIYESSNRLRFVTGITFSPLFSSLITGYNYLIVIWISQLI
jgi:uncharacterized membrane protein